MKVFLFLSVAMTASASGGCLAATGDRIPGSALAAATTVFSVLPSGLSVGYTPLPGATRVFTVPELQKLARANGLPAEGMSEVCFQVPVHSPVDSEYIEAMRKSLSPDTTLSLVDASRTPIPDGQIEFPLSGLEPVAQGNAGVQLWRGFVQYTDTRRLSVWAHVLATVSYPAVVTLKELPANAPIDAIHLNTEIRSGPLNRPAVAASVREAAGRILLHSLKSGAEIPLAFLEEPPLVRRGDSVRIEVQSGSAILRFDAVAESTARAGGMAELRNPLNGKIFRARIDAAASASGPKAVIVVGKAPVL